MGRRVCYTGVLLHQRTHLRTHSLQVMHICVYVYMYVYACVCIWMRMCVYDIAWHVEALLVRFSICTYVYICMRMCMCVHVCVFSACVYVCICLYVCVYTHVYVYMYCVCVCVCGSWYQYFSVWTVSCMRMCFRVHMYACTCVCGYIYMCIFSQ